jgi:hypothetical protein
MEDDEDYNPFANADNSINTSSSTINNNNVISGSAWSEGNEFASSLYRLKPRDTDGNLVMVFLPTLVKRTLVDLQLDVRESRFGEFLLKSLNSAAFDGPRYVAIIVFGEDASNPSAGGSNGGLSRSDLLYMMELFSSLERKVRKAIQHVYIVHPTPVASSGLWLIRKILSNKFWRKLAFVRRLSDVPNIDTNILKDSLPRWATSADTAEERRRSLAKPGTVARPALLMNFSSHWRVAPQFVGAYLWEQIDKSPFGLPSFVVRAITYLCLHGIKVEGLFRESANKERVVYSRTMLAAGQDVDFGGYWSPTGRPATQEDVHVVAALLKMYFRDSPLSILGHGGFVAVMQLATQADVTTTQLIESLKNVMRVIEAPNRYLLHFLLLFLNYMVKYERINRMGFTAMSVCWGPNLIRDESDQTSAGDFLMAMGTVHHVANVLIEHVVDIFPIDETTIFPPCHSSETGEPLPLDKVLEFDVTRAASSPSLVEDREYDDMLATQVKNESKLDGSVLAVAGEGGGGGADGIVEPTSLEDVENMSIRDLKTWLSRRQFDVSVCKEKMDLINMGKKCWLESVGGGPGRKPSLSSSTGTGRTNSLTSGAVAVLNGRVGGGGGGVTTPPATPGDGSIFRSTVAVDYDLLFDEVALSTVSGDVGTVPSRNSVTAKANNTNAKHQALSKNTKDLITSCRGMKLRFPLRTDFLMDEQRLIELDAEELRNTALFGSMTEAIAAQQGIETDFGGMKRWSLKDISTMSTSELKQLITAHGYDYADCKGVSALRERARECLLGGVWG